MDIFRILTGGIAGPIVNLIKIVWDLGNTAVVNKRRAKTWADRVNSVGDALKGLDFTQTRNDPRLKTGLDSGLDSLKACLEECRSLLSRYQKKDYNLACRLLQAGADEEDFAFVNERLQNCILELQLRIHMNQMFEPHRDDAGFLGDLQELKDNQQKILRLLGNLPQLQQQLQQLNVLLRQQQVRRSTPKSLPAFQLFSRYFRQVQDLERQAESTLKQTKLGPITTSPKTL
ncbi:hypothetical protein HK102_012087 [Quaeritorhiza haematococci]|nr:hypothetical protein HK102_012087 [Quaeritorhiza haematococci]